MLNAHGRYVTSIGVSETGRLHSNGISEDGVPQLRAFYTSRTNGGVAGGHSVTSISYLNGIGGAIIAGAAFFAVLTTGVGGAIAAPAAEQRYYVNYTTEEGLYGGGSAGIEVRYEGRGGGIAASDALMQANTITGSGGGVVDDKTRVEPQKYASAGGIAEGEAFIRSYRWTQTEDGLVAGGAASYLTRLYPKGGMAGGGEAEFGDFAIRGVGGGEAGGDAEFSAYGVGVGGGVMDRTTHPRYWRGIVGTGGGILLDDNLLYLLYGWVRGMVVGGSAGIQANTITGSGGGVVDGYAEYDVELENPLSAVTDNPFRTHFLEFSGSQPCPAVMDTPSWPNVHLQYGYWNWEGGVARPAGIMGISAIVGKGGGVSGLRILETLRLTSTVQWTMLNPIKPRKCYVHKATGGGVMGSRGISPLLHPLSAVLHTTTDIQQKSIKGTSGGVIDRLEAPPYQHDLDIHFSMYGSGHIQFIRDCFTQIGGAIAGGYGPLPYILPRGGMVVGSRAKFNQSSIAGTWGGVVDTNVGVEATEEVFGKWIGRGISHFQSVWFAGFDDTPAMVLNSAPWGPANVYRSPGEGTIVPFIRNSIGAVANGEPTIWANNVQGEGGGVLWPLERPLVSYVAKGGAVVPKRDTLILRGKHVPVSPGGGIMGSPRFVYELISEGLRAVMSSASTMNANTITGSEGGVIGYPFDLQAIIARRDLAIKLITSGEAEMRSSGIMTPEGGAEGGGHVVLFIKKTGRIGAVIGDQTDIQQKSICGIGGGVAAGHSAGYAVVHTIDGMVAGGDAKEFYYRRWYPIKGSVGGGRPKIIPIIAPAGGMVVGGSSPQPYGGINVEGGAVVGLGYWPVEIKKKLTTEVVFTKGPKISVFYENAAGEGGGIGGITIFKKPIMPIAVGTHSMVMKCIPDIQQKSINPIHAYVNGGETGMVIDRLFPPEYKDVIDLPMIATGPPAIKGIIQVASPPGPCFMNVGAGLDNTRIMPIVRRHIGLVTDGDVDIQQKSIRGTGGALASGHSDHRHRYRTNLTLNTIESAAVFDDFMMCKPEGGAVVSTASSYRIALPFNSHGKYTGMIGGGWLSNLWSNKIIGSGGGVVNSCRNPVRIYMREPMSAVTANPTRGVQAFIAPPFEVGSMVFHMGPGAWGGLGVYYGIPQWRWWYWHWIWWHPRSVVAGGSAKININRITGTGGARGGLASQPNTIIALLDSLQKGVSMIAGGSAVLIELYVEPTTPGGGTGGGDNFIFPVIRGTYGGVVGGNDNPSIHMPPSTGGGVLRAINKQHEVMIGFYSRECALGLEGEHMLLTTFSLDGVQKLANFISEGYASLISNSQVIEADYIVAGQKLTTSLPQQLKATQINTQKISESLSQVIKAINTFERNPQSGSQAVRTSITKSLGSLITSVQVLSEATAALQISELVIEADHHKEVQALHGSVANKINSVLTALQYISDSVDSIQVNKASLEATSQQATQITTNSLVKSVEGITAHLQEMSSGLSALQPNQVAILEDTLQDIQTAMQEITDAEVISGIQSVSQIVGEATTALQSVEYDIYLDGVSIKDRVTDIEIDYSEGTVHNSISVDFSDQDLYFKCDPLESGANVRLEVHVGARVFFFLIEERTGEDADYQIWGRGPSARIDEPFASEITFTADPRVMAAEAAETLADVCALDWECGDWLLPSTFSASGTPISIIESIAKEIGAVVRAQDDGSILVRRKYPVRPIDMASSQAAVNYDRFANLIKLSAKDVKGGNFNSIQVFGQSTTPGTVTLIAEEESPERGKDVHVRAYWQGKDLSVLETFVTDGLVGLMSGGEVLNEETTDDVVINEYKATVQKPILEILGYESDPDGIGPFTYDIGYPDILCGERFALASLTYKTRYKRFLLSGHDVEKLLFVLITGSEHDISVVVTMDTNGYEAPALKADSLTSDNVAVEAGTAWLDDNRYDYKTLTIETPYHDNAIDGALVNVDDGELGVSGNGHLTKVSIRMQGPRVINKIEVKKCRV